MANCRNAIDAQEIFASYDDAPRMLVSSMVSSIQSQPKKHGDDTIKHIQKMGFNGILSYFICFIHVFHHLTFMFHQLRHSMSWHESNTGLRCTSADSPRNCCLHQHPILIIYL